MSEVRLTGQERLDLADAVFLHDGEEWLETTYAAVEAIVAARLAVIEAIVQDEHGWYCATHNETFDLPNGPCDCNEGMIRAALTAAPDSEDRQAGRALRGPQSPAAGLGGSE